MLTVKSKNWVKNKSLVGHFFGGKEYHRNLTKFFVSGSFSKIHNLPQKKLF
jgi:hypothetical protein